MRYWPVIILFTISLFPLFAEDAESVYQEGVAKLRLAQADHSALVPATKLLAKAASLF